MSIASEITRIQGAKASLKTAIEGKGVEVSSDALIDKYADHVYEIEQAGGGGGDTTAEDGLIDGTLTEYSNDRVTQIRNYAFNGCKSLTTVDLPLATSVGTYAFYNCSSLTTVDLPSAKSVGSSAFDGCKSLTTVDLPLVTSVGTYAFNGCSSLTTASLPVATSVGNYAFRRSYPLTAVILRNTTKVCTLLNTNAFNDCYHLHGIVDATYNPDGLKDGYIYVPASLIENYKGATNWSTFATQFRALEDYTVDGTTTGELDESKIRGE